MYRTDMSATKRLDIHEATEADRSILGRLSPPWFSRHMPDVSWCAVEDGQVVAAIMIEFGSDGHVDLELNGTDETAIHAAGPELLSKAIESARRSGATSLDANTDTLASRKHLDFLLSQGFEKGSEPIFPELLCPSGCPPLHPFPDWRTRSERASVFSPG